MTSKNKTENVIQFNPNPSREEAMRAVKTLIAWAGDDPEREGLIETPKRVVKACLLYTSPSPRDKTVSRMPSSA